MKKFQFNIAALLLLLFVTSCELNDFTPSEWAVDPELSLSESGIVASSVAEEHSVLVTSNYQKFTAESNQSWCKVTTDTDNKTVYINVDSNDGADQRTAVITVSVSRGTKSLSKDVTIYQIGGKWDVIEGTDIRMRWAYDVSESQKSIISNQLRQQIYVEGGTFLMGAQNTNKSESNYYEYANVFNWKRQVTLSDYYIGKYEVTQEQWAAVMPTTPSRFSGGNKPVENISWEEAVEYATKLAKLTGLVITLPTSAQWEYAARGGKYSMGYKYAGSDDLSQVAYFLNYSTPEDSPYYTTSEVGSKSPNELGLYDMTGNVSELCSDWYGEVSTEPQIDPTGPITGNYHVLRGGDFTDYSPSAANVFRVTSFLLSSTKRENKTSFAGLRIVMKR